MSRPDPTPLLDLAVKAGEANRIQVDRCPKHHAMRSVYEIRGTRIVVLAPIRLAAPAAAAAGVAIEGNKIPRRVLWYGDEHPAQLVGCRCGISVRDQRWAEIKDTTSQTTPL